MLHLAVSKISAWKMNWSSEQQPLIVALIQHDQLHAMPLYLYSLQSSAAPRKDLPLAPALPLSVIHPGVSSLLHLQYTNSKLMCFKTPLSCERS